MSLFLTGSLGLPLLLLLVYGAVVITQEDRLVRFPAD